MTAKNYQFWIYYAAAWLFYAFSLGAVFVAQGGPLGANLLASVFCNVAPAVLLGGLVVKFARKLRWSERRKVWFVFVHIFTGFLFAASWCFVNLVFLSVWISYRDGAWQFNWLGNYALQWQMLSGLMAYLTITSAVYVGQVNESLQIEERRNAELEMRAIRAESARRQAELSALRAQLNPHFLFNTLHTLMALVRTDANAAENAIERFALMLRYVLQSQSVEKSGRLDVLFADEWEFIQNYLELENLRLGARLKTVSNIAPDALDCRLPAFLLQPLIENSVKWAISPRVVGGEININARVENDSLKITVKDDGAGAVRENALNAKGFGLRLIREILATRYGEAANLSVETSPHQGFTANLTIPADR